MPVDTSIYGNLLRPAKSLSEYSSELDQADLGRNQLAAQKVNLIGAQQDLADQQKVREVYSRPDFDPMNPKNLPEIYRASPKAGAAAQKALFEAEKTRAETTRAQGLAPDQVATTAATNQKTAADQFALARQKIDLGMQIVTTARDPASAHAKFQQAVQQGLMTPEEAAQKEQEVPQDPVAFKGWRSDSIDALMNAKERVTAAETSRHNTASEADTRRGQDISAKTARDINAANIGRDYAVAGLGPDGKDTGGGTGGLSPAAIEAGAARYLVDGTLPTNVGRGAQGARDIRKMLNRAGELAVGIDPTQQRVNQLDAKSAGAALTQLTKAKTMAGAFEDTANQNAELALGLSKKNDRTGSPLLNSGLQAYRTGTGVPGAMQFNASPEASQFAASVDTFTGEYAKIMSGGMGNGPVSDSARNKASHLLSTSMTPQQFEDNVKLLQTEMRNRMKGFDDTEKALRGRIGGKAEPAARAESGPATIPTAPSGFTLTHIDGKAVK